MPIADDLLQIARDPIKRLSSDTIKRRLAEVAARDGVGCKICGALAGDAYQVQFLNGSIITFEHSAQLDHVIPLWKFRYYSNLPVLYANSIENLQILCGNCHDEKTAFESIERTACVRAIQGILQ